MNYFSVFQSETLLLWIDRWRTRMERRTKKRARRRVRCAPLLFVDPTFSLSLRNLERLPTVASLRGAPISGKGEAARRTQYGGGTRKYNVI